MSDVRGGVAGERILIVEDDEDYRALLQLRLTGEGCTTAAAARATEALELIEDFAPTVVITDLSMPGMDGLQLCRDIRARERWRQLPILVLSGVEDSSAVGEVVGLGLIWYLSKTVEWPQFLRTLTNLVTRAYAVPESRLA